MSQSLGASLGARFAVSSQENIERRKKKVPRNKTMACASTLAHYNAVGLLAIKLDVTRSRVIEIALEELLAKHDVQVGDDSD